MENGNGLDVQPTGRALWPWERAVIAPEPSPVLAEGDIAIPASSTPDQARKPLWYETEEGRAKRGALIKAGWAKRRAAQQRAASRLAAAQKEVDSTAKAAGLDAAIEFHRNALNTLLAAKALLK